MDTRREDIRLATITPTNESQAENGAPTTYEPQKERRVKWKLDLTILPLLSSIQFLSQMVRNPGRNYASSEANSGHRQGRISGMPKSPD